MSAENWKHKDELKEKAELWNRFIEEKYKEENEHCISVSEIYDSKDKDIPLKTKIMVVKDTSHVAIFKTKYDGKMCVLNFASYKKPGGEYINGAMAQEESLCHCSNLYKVLSDNKFKDDFYGYNNKHLNRALYGDRSIYSHDIVFFNSDKTKTKKCDVITCAAPNKKASQEYQNVSDIEVNSVMKSRILHILDVAMRNNVKVLILGAFGCGVFGNDTLTVAKIFKQCITDYYYFRNIFDLVIFAIPDTDKYDIFRTVFGDII